jgi:hypothetical protein
MIKAVRSHQFQTLDTFILSLELIASGNESHIPTPLRNIVDTAIADARSLQANTKKPEESSREGLYLKCLFAENPAVATLLQQTTCVADIPQDVALKIISVLD